MYKLEFIIQELPPTINNTSYLHWAVKAQGIKAWKVKVLHAVGRNKPKAPLLMAKLTLTRHSAIQPDFDNLCHSFKSTIDGLKMAGVIYDDKFSIIGKSEYLWAKAPQKKGFISVKVEELPRVDLELEAKKARMI